MCQVDNPDEAALLPHAFPLLVVYFLQRKKIIPVLHEMVDAKNDPYAYLGTYPSFSIVLNVNYRSFL